MHGPTASTPPAVRRLLVPILGLLLVATTAACGSSDGGEGSGGPSTTRPTLPTTTPSGPTTTVPSTDPAAYPVTIDHALGSTTIEAPPERIAAVGLTDQDVLLALGVLPVLTVEWFAEQPGAIFPWAADEAEALGGVDDIVVLDPNSGIAAEQVAVAEPDLIVGLYGAITEDQYAELSKIAPTVVQPPGPGYSISWQDQTLTMGTIVGKRAFAEKLVAQTEEAIAAVRDAHPELEGRTGIMVAPYEGIFVYGSHDPRGRVLEELGLVIPDELDAVATGPSAGQLSLENADLLDVDVVIWLEQGPPEGDVGGPIYRQLGLADEGRELRIDGNDDVFGQALSFQTVLSYPYLLGELADRLSAAVDGDPATTVGG